MRFLSLSALQFIFLSLSYYTNISLLDLVCVFASSSLFCALDALRFSSACYLRILSSSLITLLRLCRFIYMLSLLSTLISLLLHCRTLWTHATKLSVHHFPLCLPVTAGCTLCISLCLSYLSHSSLFYGDFLSLLHVSLSLICASRLSLSLLSRTPPCILPVTSLSCTLVYLHTGPHTTTLALLFSYTLPSLHFIHMCTLFFFCTSCISSHTAEWVAHSLGFKT